ncbi:MAG: site-specific DNA-methyltransferase [Caldisericia bacterium]|nr:site-specific DNA-methyltransferase [Caldisericia bacterium]
MPKQQPKEEKIKITPTKGRPMLNWVGKKPLDYVKGYPAVLMEVFDPLKIGLKYDIPRFEDLEKNWQNLLFYGDNKDVLATLLEQGFRGKIDLIYIDPPFNVGIDYIRKVQLRGLKTSKIEGEGYSTIEQVMYFNNFLEDTYLQFMYERFQLLKELLNERGSIFVRMDYRFGHSIKLLLDEVFGKENFRNEIVVNRTQEFFKSSRGLKKLMVDTDSLFFYTKSNNYVFNEVRIKREKEVWWEITLPGDHRGDDTRIIFGKKFKLPKGRIWGLKQEQIEDYEKLGRLKVEKNKVFYAPITKTLKSNWTDIAGYARTTDYPTENAEVLLKRVVEMSSNPNDLVLDCFIGSGTTARVAQKLGRRWIGCDINKGAIQITSRELQKIIKEQIKKKETKYPSFAIYKVNNYDLQLLRTEAIELAVQHIGIQRTKTDSFFDGTLGKNLVKIIDFNHPFTLLDLQLIQDELKKRPNEDRDITVVCLGKELAIDLAIEEWNKKHPVNKIEVIELKTDKKYGNFLIHKPDEAKVNIERKGDKAIIEILDFISPTIIERLNIDNTLFKVKIPDYRSMIDYILIDTNYDGKTFHIVYSDVPEKKDDLIKGKYELEIPKDKVKIAVKIVDMLGEETLVSKEI